MRSPPSTPPTVKSQHRLRSRPFPLLSQPFDDPTDAQTLLSPSQKKPPFPLPLTIHQLLLLPPSPDGSKSPHVADESLDCRQSEATPLRKGKNRCAAAAMSPRNGTRRARRRLEKEIWKDEKICPMEDEDRMRRRRPSRSKPALNEKPSLMPPNLHSSTQITKPEVIAGDGQNTLDGILTAMSDLLMWKNMAKSTFWFCFGSSLILSSIFSSDFNFSIISAVSHLAVLILVLAFLCDSFTQRELKMNKAKGFQLTEDDFFRVIRIILPVLNDALAKSQEIFSGEPLMTLKVCPVLLFMTMYGHLITLRRLVAVGFFLSFTVPKLYSYYCQQIQQIVEDSRNYVLESWRSCSRKKLVATLATTLMWNMSSVKMRTYAAFISVVIIRCHRQKIFVVKYAEEETVSKSRMNEEQYHHHVEDDLQQEMEVEVQLKTNKNSANIM